jgi:hypothetical protein
VFDSRERERIRYHMGYLSVAPAASITFGIPVPIQTLFLIELSMDNVLPDAEDRVRKFLTILDDIECRMIDGQTYLVATRMDEIEVRPDHIDKLEDEYSRWAARMADELGAPLYPGSYKFRRMFQATGAGSIPVKNG